MLPPFIIEQIRRREEQEQERARHEQPRLELPIDIDRPLPRSPQAPDDKAERGVVIIDLMND